MTPRSARLAVRPPFISYRRDNGQQTLHCEQLPLATLAERLGTPLYIYSESMIRERVLAFDQAFRHAPHTTCYSVKANSNLSVLRLIYQLNCGFDVVSGGELERVLEMNRRAANKVVFSGVGKSRDELKAALIAGILLFNVESESELFALADCAAECKKIARIALRVNPDIPANTHAYISTGLTEHKFGIPIVGAERLYATAARNRWLKVAGVSVHIGSQITEVKPFAASMRRVAELVRRLRLAGHAIEYVDAGGGLGISYDKATNFQQQLSRYAKALLTPLQRLGVHLLLEPGRFIVGPAGVLLTRILYRKANGKKKFLIVDAAMNDLMRPALYSAYHEIVAVNAPKQRKFETVDVVGPVCESGDFLGRLRALPITQEGDLLAILDAGAYGMSLASNYNSRARAAEVLVHGKSVKLIRRRESIRDLLACEK